MTLEQAVESYLERRRRGEDLDAQAYSREHPELGEELLEALESLEALERARHAPGVAPDEHVGRFRIVRELGRGGMGVVYEAIEEPLRRRVALKLLPPELLASPSARARFRREAELASRLEHPCICTVFGAGVESESPWIAMRLFAGETLARLIAQARERGEHGLPLPGAGASGRARALAVASRIALVARALQSAHEQGVLHRDVKPSNVMITPSGEPVLLDFGLAFEENSDVSSLTRTGETAGTPAYLAPELVSGEIARPDARTDVYALGVTLYECLALRPPFQGPTRASLYRSILSGAPPDVRRSVKDVPRDLAVVVATAIERDRSRRYAGAADLAADLDAAVEGRPIAARPVSALGKLTRWARREPRQALLASLFAAASLGLALASGILLASRDDIRAAELAARDREVERAIVEGFRELADNRHEEADTLFGEAIALDPGSLEARAGRVLVSIDRKRDGEALDRLAGTPHTPAFDALRAMASGAPHVVDEPAFARAPAFELFVEGERLRLEAERSPRSQRQEMNRRALDRLTQAVVRSPSARSLYHLERARAANTARDLDAARSASAALLTLWPDSPRVVFNAGHALMSVDPTRAEEVLERAAALEPRFAVTYQNLGNVRWRLGNLEGAERALRKAIALDPSSAYARNSLGIVMHSMGCAEEAREAWTAALSIQPGLIEPRAGLANLESELGDHAAAERHLAIAVELDPWHAMLRRMWALALFELGRFDEAADHFGFALALDPSVVIAWEGLAGSHLHAGRLDEALRIAEAGLEAVPESEAHGLRQTQAEALQALGVR